MAFDDFNHTALLPCFFNAYQAIWYDESRWRRAEKSSVVFNKKSTRSPFMDYGFYFWLSHITWLIFDGKILRNPSCFARLQTAGGMRPCKTFVFLVFSLSNRWKWISAKINHSLWHRLYVLLFFKKVAYLFSFFLFGIIIRLMRSAVLSILAIKNNAIAFVYHSAISIIYAFIPARIRRG